MKRWLDSVIAAKKTLAALEDYKGLVRLVDQSTERIHVYEGIETLAAELKQPLVYDPNWDTECGRISFYYKGYEVFQLWDKSRTKENN